MVWIEFTSGICGIRERIPFFYIFLLCSTGSLSEPVYILELAVLALSRIMCADIHSQNGTAILAQDRSLLCEKNYETLSAFPPLCV